MNVIAFKNLKGGGYCVLKSYGLEQNTYPSSACKVAAIFTKVKPTEKVSVTVL